jgi:ribonuclease J
MGMAKGRLEEFGLVAKSKFVAIEPEKDVLQLGVFKVSPFRLIHSIPGAIGLEIETPNGRIAYCTDWKFDYTPADGKQIDFRTLAAVGSRGVDLLFSDSTNVDRPGHSISEKVVAQSLTTAIGEAKNRVIIAMFSSDLNRIQMALNAAASSNRKVLFLGRSMQNNVEMAIGLKALNVPPNTIISEREANRFQDNQMLVISTGAQGEDRSALYRMASGEHRIIKIKKGDTVILSSSPIPGNERAVSGVMDKLYKAGASVIYNKILDVHTSGHAYQEDLKLMLALMKPKYFVPLHGERARLIMHGKLAEEVGVQAENVIIGDNGLILEMDNTGKVVPTDNHVPAGYVMVDGLGIGDVGNIVIRDRQAMAQEGVFFIVSVYDSKSKRFLNSPDIISRGFIYMRENEKFVNDVRNEIKSFLQKATSDKKIDISSVRNDLRDMVSKHLYEKTERQPMVIPVIIEV